MSVQYVADKEKVISRGNEDEPSCVLWVEPNIVIAGTLDGDLRAWDEHTGLAFDPPLTKVHRLGIHSLSYSAESEMLLTAALDGTLALWKFQKKPSSPQESTADRADNDDILQDGLSAGPWPFSHTQSFFAGGTTNGLEPPIASNKLAQCGVFLRAALHPSKAMFAIVGANADLLLYNAGPGEAGALLAKIDSPQTLKGKGKGLKKDFGVSLEFDTTGQTIAVGTQRGFVYLIDVEDRSVRTTISGHSMAVRALHFTKDENLLVGCDDGKVTIYDVKVATYTFDSQSASLDLFGDDFSEANSSQYTGMTDSSQGKSSIFSRTNSLKDHYKASSYVRSFDSNSMWLSCIKASPDGRILATCSIDGHIRIWDLAEPTSSPLYSAKEPREVWSLAWKPLTQDRHVDTTMTSRTTTTAAAQSVLTASAFVTANADGKVRWYRCPGMDA